MRKLAEKAIREERLFRHDELHRRLAHLRDTLWYVPALAQNDVLRYEAVFRTRWLDAMRALRLLIEK